MIRLLYSLVLFLALPLVLIRLWWRGHRLPAYRQRWRERFGFGLPRSRQVIWLHAVSVGETVAAAPLIKALQQRYPEHSLLITSTTPTGSERVRALFGDSVLHCYLPYDLPVFLKRLMRHTRPSLLVLMETELWPNLLHCCQARGIPVALVNARLSERSARGYQRLPTLTRDVLSCLWLIAAQAQADAARFIRLGADSDAVTVTGSLKFDTTPEHAAITTAREMRALWQRPVWVAASTHAGEEEQMLHAHCKLLTQQADALLILVPRHPDRFSNVQKIVHDSGLRYVTRRSNHSITADTQVLLADTMGEMPLWYACGDVAFIGGSLVPGVGGHNMLEAIALNTALLMGPSFFNFQTIGEQILACHGMQLVHSPDELADTTLHLLTHATARNRLTANAQNLLDNNRGALERTLEKLDGLLHRNTINDI